MNTLRARPFLFALVGLLGLLATSCGGSDEVSTGASGEDSADSSVDDADSSVDDAGTDGDDGGGSSGSGGSAEQFCAASAEAEALFEDIDPFDPEAVEAAAKKNLELLEAAIPIAPAEVRDDLITIRENFDDYLAVLEDNGWDFFAAAPEIEELESRSEPAAAGDRLDAWEDANCEHADAEADDAAEEDPFSTPEAFEAMLSSDAGRALIIEGMTEDGSLTVDQAGCLLDNLDFESLSMLGQGDAPTPEVLGAFLEVVDRCDLGDMFGMDETGGSDGDAGSFDEAFADAEMLEAIMGSDAGRAMLIEGMTEDGALTVDQAGCLLDNLEIEMLVLFGQGGEPEPDMVFDLFEVLETCGITEDLLSG